MVALVGVNELKWPKICCNPSLGLATKTRTCKSVRQEGGLRDTSYIPESAGECERMNPHTPKVTPSWGIGVPMESRIFKEQLQIRWKIF